MLLQNDLYIMLNFILIKKILKYFIKTTVSKLSDFNYNNCSSLVAKKIVRIKWQTKYLLNNWVYSTNHKRISINYFWFVLLAGIVGMVLATIIRVEMAYPGIGILAGDNTQYLSIVTAHGVIMVFFMAMPLLFGFFTNFLLPTQLGVHDVAFPRMNSAAFWFLPASLIILCQLVCVDRRYNRMNCFNARQLQTLVRKKFFFELNNPKTYNELVSKSLMGLKYQTLNSNLNLSTNKNLLMLGLDNSTFLNSNLYSEKSSNHFSNNTSFDIFKNTKQLGDESLFTPKLIRSFRITNWRYNFQKKWSLFDFFNIQRSSKFYDMFYLNYFYSFFINNGKSNLMKLDSFDKNFYQSSIIEKSNFISNTFIENNSNKRFLQFEFPTLLFKAKTGNFFKEQITYNFKHILNTVNQKTISFRKPSWLVSEFINSKLTSFDEVNTFSFNSTKSENEYNYNLYNLVKTSNSHKLEATYGAGLRGLKDVRHNNMDIFYFIFRSNSNYNNLNSKWSTQHNFDYKFINLFFDQSKQALALNNWKNLKLSREGWRCRMLISRNQNSLFSRYIGERTTAIVIERNAKDLLPGWALITPFSSRTKYTLPGKTDIGAMVVLITLIASMVSCSNFLITYRYLSTLNNRKMRDARSFFAEAIVATCWMTLAANPMLIIGLVMLMSDRHWRTSFFDYSGGGDVILFQHMFWFFGHPEVYIIIVPCFGLVNTMLSFYLRKRISARASLMYSMYTIAFLGFFVWGHHMYMVGLSHSTRMLYSTLTVMISVPAATKIMHWLVTFINSSIHFELPLFFVIAFIFFFLSGGISGMSVAHTGMDVLFHDTFFVIGHFHVMLGGSLMFAGFGGIYFYLPSIFGIRYNKFFAYLHFFYYLIGQLFTVIPMIWLGYSGMPRRVLDYPAALGGWHSLSTSAHILSIAGILCFIIMLTDSMRKRKPYTIKTFGVGRYNTRLNFYVYEMHRNKYWSYKSNSLYNYKMKKRIFLPSSNIESVLFFYHLGKK